MVDSIPSVCEVGGSDVYFSSRICLRSAHLAAIIELAGKPGDRWASLRKKASREESPDTVIANGNVRD